jgi:hypothetical protein
MARRTLISQAQRPQETLTKKRSAGRFALPIFWKQVTKYRLMAAILRNASHFAKQGDGSCSCLMQKSIVKFLILNGN